MPITQTIFKQYGFITYPLLTVFTGGFLFFFFPFPLIPDFLNIKSYPKIYDLFNLIISSLVSLIGIYISVSLVAYEFFKQKSGIDFHKSFLINRISAYYISFAVSTIIFAFICSISVSSFNPNYKEISIIYYNAILFIFVIAFLFPVAFNLFSSLKPEKLAHEELEKIDGKTIFIRIADKENIDEQVSLFENDPLIKIENILIALISVSDNIKSQAIIHKVSLKLCNLIIDEEAIREKEYIIERLVSFYIKLIDFSLLQPNNTPILKSIWVSIDKMYSVLIKRKESAIHYEKFRKNLFDRYFNRLIENNKEELIYEGITTLSGIIQKQVLFNMPDDKDIYYLNTYRRAFEKDFKEPERHTDEDFRNGKQWNEIAVDTMESFTFLINKAIKLNKVELLNKCFEELNKLTFKLYSKKIGIYKQCFFYISSANIICDYAYTAFEKNIFSESNDAKFLTPSLFTSLIEEKHPAARTVLQKYCYLLINIQKINKLDRWFLGGLKIGDFITTEGTLGGIAKRCAIKYNDGKEIQDCLEDCINTFKILKEFYEQDILENYDLYQIIKWQFTNIKTWLEKTKTANESIINTLNEEIASFKNV